MNPYKTLGIKRDASADDIKKAFREKAKKHHPDLPGGCAEKFKEAKKAYDILCDGVQRAMFDKHGFSLGADSAQYYEAAIAEIRNMFIEAVGQVSPEHFEGLDIIDIMTRTLKSGIADIAAQIKASHAKLKNLKIYAVVLEKRMKNKNNGEANLFMVALEKMKGDLLKELELMDNATKCKKLAVEILTDYHFDVRGFSAAGGVWRSSTWVGMAGGIGGTGGGGRPGGFSF